MKEIKELFIKYKEIILYLVFGGLTTFVNIIVYYLCEKVGLFTVSSTVIAWVLSILFAYITNKMYVFESQTQDFFKLLREIFEFFICRLATGVLDLLIMVAFVDGLGANGLVIKIVSNITVIIANYILSKVLIFKKK